MSNGFMPSIMTLILSCLSIWYCFIVFVISFANQLFLSWNRWRQYSRAFRIWVYFAVWCLKRQWNEFATSLKWVPCMPVCFICLHGSVPKAWQLLIFMCPHAKGVPIIQFDMPICQRSTNYSTSSAKRCTSFSTTFQRNFSTFEFFSYP